MFAQAASVSVQSETDFQECAINNAQKTASVTPDSQLFSD